MQLLNYEGIVRLKIINTRTQKIREKIAIHNEGSNSLFYFLCSCLVGIYDKEYAPLALDALNSNYSANTPDNSASILSYRILLTKTNIIKNITIKLDNNDSVTYPYVASFNAMIPYHAIMAPSSKNKEIQCIQLHSKLSQADKLDSLLAWVNLPKVVTITEGEALLVEWNLGFTNPKQQ